LVLGIFGILVIIIGIYGFCASCNQSACCLISASIILFLVIIAILGLGVAVLFLGDQVAAKLDGYCNSTNVTEKICAAILGLTYNETTREVYGPPGANVTTISEALKEFKSFVSGNLKMIGVTAIYIAVFAVYLALAPWFLICAKRAARKRAAQKDGDAESGDILRDIAEISAEDIKKRAIAMGAKQMNEPPLSLYYGHAQPLPEH